MEQRISAAEPSVSIIMPAYNAQRYIRTAVDSVIAQTFQNWELIIIDDCSKDETLEIAKKYAAEDERIHLIINPQNQGASASRHCGIQAASAKWLAFLDSDDAWEPEKLELQLQLAGKTGGQLFFTASAFMDENGTRLGYTLHAPATLSYREICKQNLLSNSSSMVDRKLFLAHEVVADNIHEDFACWLSIMKTGVTAYGIDQPLLIYRVTANSKSGNKLHAAKMNWNTYRITGMPLPVAAYNMCFYTIRGFKKYRQLK